MITPEGRFDFNKLTEDTERDFREGRLSVDKRDIPVRLDGQIIAVERETETKVPFVKRTAQQWQHLDRSAKMDVGVSGAIAMLSAMGAVNAARHTVTHDEKGKAHIQWTQAGVALLQGVIAAASAAYAMQTINTRSML